MMVDLQNIPIQFSLEGWVHYLLNIGKLSKDDLENTILLPISCFFRNYSPEIHLPDSNDREEFPYRHESGEESSKIVWINRDGLYHKLPYFLFHKFNTSDESKNLTAKIEEERKELVNAMKVLLPLDNEFILQRILLFHEVKAYANQTISDLFTKIFDWKIRKISKDYGLQLNEIPQIFFSLLQFKDRIAQDKEFFQEGFSLVFLEFYLMLLKKKNHDISSDELADKHKIDITLECIKYIDYPERFLKHDEYLYDIEDIVKVSIGTAPITFAPRLKYSRLGECKLGVNATCGMPYPDEFYFNLKMTLYKRNPIGLFIDPDCRRKMEMLAEMYFNFFAPLNYKLLHPFKIEVKETVAASLGGYDATLYSNVLGYGIILYDRNTKVKVKGH